MGKVTQFRRKSSLHDGCEISNLSVDERNHAIEVGRAILENPERRAEYGQFLLRLSIQRQISQAQSSALILCLRNTIHGHCPGLMVSDTSPMPYNGASD